MPDAPPVPNEALELHEGSLVNLQEGQADDGTVLIHVIRPGVGKGRGNHLYEADMLKENAEKFTGWPMYIDHLSPEARKAMGGLPRSMRDTGGIIKESWWDGSVPAEGDYGQGAVMAKVKPIGFAKTMIEEAPEIVGASISATATGVKPVTKDGKRVWMVEGINPKGSVDWVTEAGAGGRVVSLVESAYPSQDDVDAPTDIDTLTDEQLRDYLSENREALLEALGETPDNDKPDQEGDMAQETITAEALQEALQREGIIEQLNEAINVVVEQRVGEAIEEALGENLGDTISQKVSDAIESERDVIHAEARANADRAIKLRDMRDAAHSKIAESRLPESWKDEVRKTFDLTESGPTPALDQVDEVGEDGEVTKAASALLTEAVEAELDRQTELLRAVTPPTRVRGQGPSRQSDEDKSGDDKTENLAEGTLYGAVLQEAGIDASTAYTESK